MKTKLTKTQLSFLFLLISFATFAQIGTVSGVLKDNQGVPIPGVNVIAKGSSNGVSTDFDGLYSITCSVGDVLQFNYIGYGTKEITVTSAMFGATSNTVTIKKTPVALIKTKGYTKALEKYKKDTFYIASVADSEKNYNRSSYFEHNRIKDITIKKDKVKLTYFNPDIYFEVGLKTINGFQFVKDGNLPQLQNTYSQGIASNGEFTVQGPETGTIFSYGPQLNLLEFNGENYPFDSNGRLVNTGNGNGTRAKVYDNSIFSAGLNSTHNLFFTINSKVSSFRFDVTHNNQKDLYNIERNTSNTVLLKYENKPNNNKNSWNAFIKINTQNDNQPNINGFQNNLLLNAWATPASFSNNQGDRLQNNLQRSFAPNSFNNPNWLLNMNRNREKHNSFISSFSHKINISDGSTIFTKVNYSNFKNTQNFGVVQHTNGLSDGYLSNRNWDKNNLNIATNITFKKQLNRSELKFGINTDFFYEDLKYRLFQAEGFTAFSFDNPQNSTSNQKHLYRSILRLQQKAIYNTDYDDLIIGLSNNAYTSSIQNNKWFLPTLQVKWKLDDIIDIYDFYNITLSASTAFDVNDARLLYDNLSHNSLNIRPEESLAYTEINDLFVDDALRLEEKKSLEFGLDFQFRALRSHFNFGVNYFSNTIKNSVFPVFENNTFQLKNVAHVKNNGVEMSLSTNVYFSSNFNYRPELTFSTHRPRVTALLDDKTTIPIAGFSTTSKSLIVGQPTGVIIGSAYARDTNNNRIIGNDGFPLVDVNPQIIGNPIPKYNIGFNNHISLHDFTLNVLIDIQKGGDVWNGTQNVLNYLGTSQQSASERNISNFVFDGVNAQGAQNTIPVDFYNSNEPISENRFVRYGFEGVAEDAIEDGSYINIKSIDLNYAFKTNAKDEFIRTFEVGLYANNFLTWTKFRGAAPYSNLYNNTSARHLNFFNAPLISEVGLKINLKI